MFKGLSTLVFATLLSSPAFSLIVKDKKVILEKLEDYNYCQTKDWAGDTCHKALEEWVEKHPVDAWKAGKLTRKTMTHWVALPLLKQGLEAKQGDCSDADLKMAVLSALNLSDPKSEIVMSAKKIGLETCVKEMGSAIAKESETDRIIFVNTCKELQAKKLIELGAVQKKKCEKGE